MKLAELCCGEVSIVDVIWYRFALHIWPWNDGQGIERNLVTDSCIRIPYYILLISFARNDYQKIVTFFAICIINTVVH